MAQVSVYIDGFNLYNRALIRTPYKWLDLRRFAERVLGPENRIERIRYFTAMVSGRTDPEQPLRQQIYLRALKSIPALSIHFGKFMPKEITRPLVHPPCPCRECVYVRVHTTEEKGSDVNLASYLIWDTLSSGCDTAAVVSKDTDLIEPINLLVQSGKRIGVICPEAPVPPGLAKVASFVRHVHTTDLAASQFPDPLIVAGKALRKPIEWAR
jgi:uncharacterized LabA/DUF88 family protein